MESDWDFYLCQLNGWPASILLDLAYGDSGPISEFDQCLIMRLTLQEAREDGFPTREESERLDELEDALETAWLENKSDTRHVGRVTTHGWRDFFFYCRDPQRVQQQICSVLQAFPDYPPQFAVEPDPEWQIYYGLLFPSDREWQMICNERLLRHLEESGDRPEIQRDVVHWVAFGSQENRDRFVQEVAQRGFQTRLLAESGTDMPYGVEVSRRQSADRSSIHNVVFTLYDLTKEYDGQYDGWETSVETGEVN